MGVCSPCFIARHDSIPLIPEYDLTEECHPLPTLLSGLCTFFNLAANTAVLALASTKTQMIVVAAAFCREGENLSRIREAKTFQTER